MNSTPVNANQVMAQEQRHKRIDAVKAARRANRVAVMLATLDAMALSPFTAPGYAPVRRVLRTPTPRGAKTARGRTYKPRKKGKSR